MYFRAASVPSEPRPLSFFVVDGRRPINFRRSRTDENALRIFENFECGAHICMGGCRGRRENIRTLEHAAIFVLAMEGGGSSSRPAAASFGRETFSASREFGFRCPATSTTTSHVSATFGDNAPPSALLGALA